VYDLNEAADRSVPEGSLGDLFDAMWQKLESAVSAATALAPDSDESNRSEKSMLAELVDRTRRIEDLLPAAAFTIANEPVLFAETETVVFTRKYVKHDSRSKKTYLQGTTGRITQVHTGPAGGITHVDIRLPDGEFLSGVPIDYFRA
jgi:hypothetical protein